MSQKDDVFVRVFVGVLSGLVVFTIAIIILANSVGQLEQESVTGIYGGKSTVEERISPLGKVRIAGQAPAEPAPTAAAAPPAERTGEQIVQAACAACHTSGIAGAPRTGIREDWTARLDQGIPVLLDHAINGYKGMPAKGGNPTLTDEDVKKAVMHMLEQVGASSAGTATATDAGGEAVAAPS